MLKLLGRSTSGNVQKVMWLLDEIGAEYVREDYAARTACLSSPSHQIAAPYGVKVSFRLIHYLITGTLKKNAGPKGPANLDREPERRGGRWEGGVLSTTNSVSYSSEPVTELG